MLDYHYKIAFYFVGRPVSRKRCVFGIVYQEKHTYFPVSFFLNTRILTLKGCNLIHLGRGSWTVSFFARTLSPHMRMVYGKS